MSAARDFVTGLSALGVPIFTAPPGGSEFVRPAAWQSLTADGNLERIATFRAGEAIMAVCGGVLAVVDVDPRNGGDVEQVRQLLSSLGVVVFAECATPGGGAHFYVAGHPDLPTVHATADRPGLLGLPGVDVQSHGSNSFLPGTRRPKYDGRGYDVVFDNLAALADGADPDGAEVFAGWVAEHRVSKGETFTAAPPWGETPPDARRAAYLSAVLRNHRERLAAMAPDSGRNVALFNAAMSCGNYIAGAGMDETEAVRVLTDAAAACGLVKDDGPRSVAATIRSGLRNGRARPRAVPAVADARAHEPSGEAPARRDAPPGDDRARPLESLLDAVRELHHVEDEGPVVFTLAVATSAALEDGPPLWGMHVDAPSSGKTTTQEVVADVAEDSLDELTPAGLLSWSRGGKKGEPQRRVGLLARVGDCGFVTVGDFSTILATSDRGGRDQLFGDLRRVYDGHLNRGINSPTGEPLRWSGRLTLLAAVTPEIDRYSSHGDALGPRWLYIRGRATDTTHKRAAARKARRHRKDAAAWAGVRSQAAALVRDARARVGAVQLSEGALDQIEDAALVACWGRAAVPRHPYGRREVDGVVVVEEPPRLVRQLTALTRCAVALGVSEEQAVALARRCALDTVPAARRDVLSHLSMGEPLTVSELSRRTGHHRDVVRRALEDLSLVGVTICPLLEHTDTEPDDWRRTAPTPWELRGVDGKLCAEVLQDHARDDGALLATRCWFFSPTSPQIDGETGPRSDVTPTSRGKFGETT